MKEMIPFDITRNKFEKEEPEELRLGATRIFDWLYLGGEDDAEDVIEKMDMLIDFRNESIWNRKIYVPHDTAYIRMPFEDGDLKGLERTLPLAKTLVDYAARNEQNVMVICHAGISRSASLVLWIASETLGSFNDAINHVKALRPIQIDRNFEPFLTKLKKQFSK